jgi:O-antigen/teichoic acid export membrane protein
VSILGRIAAFLALGVAGQLVGIAAGITQARMLGPEGKSVLAYATVGLAMVLTMSDGFTAAVLTQAGRDKRPARAVHAAMLRVIGLLGAPAAVLLLAVALAFASQRPLIGAAVAIPLGLYVQGSRGLMLSRGKTRALVVQGALNTVVFGLVLIALLLFSGLDATGTLVVWIAGWAAAAAYGFWFVRRLAGSDAPVAAPDLRAMTFQQLRGALKNGAAMFAGFLNLRIDVFIVSALLGARELGIYTLAIASGELLWNLSQPVAHATLDRIAGADVEDAVALVKRMTRNSFVVLVALGVLAAIFGPPAIRLVYGERFAASGPLLLLLLPGLVVYAARVLVGYFILVRLERPLFLMWTQLASAAACAAITLVLLPRFGLAGAALATSSTYLAVVAVLVVMFCRATGTRPTSLFIPTAADLAWYEARLQAVASSWLGRYLPSQQ